jgi:AcrR family transcriptional regulator
MSDSSPNRRGAKTRVALIDAAWRIVDGMSLGDLLVSLTPSRVAAESAKTSGSFHHHFPSHAAFVTAMVDQLLLSHDADEEIETVTPFLDQESSPPGPSLARAAALADWDLWQRPDRHRRLLREDLLETTAPTTTLADGRSLRRVLAVEHWDRSIGELSAMYDAFLEAMGRRLVEPFTTEQITKVIAAVLEGLLLSANLAPGAVDREMFANLIACIVTTFSAPVAVPVRLVDLEIGAIASIETAPDLDLARRWGCAALPVIDEGTEVVHFSTVAAAIGVEPRDLAEVFGTPRRLAAAGLAIALPDLAGSFSGSSIADDATAGLGVLVGHARLHRLAATSLLAERDAGRSKDPGDTGSFDIDAVVPFDECLAAALTAVGAAGPNVVESASIAIDSALLLAVTRPDWSTHEIARVAGSVLVDPPGR